jgi:hypothetical protein
VAKKKNKKGKKRKKGGTGPLSEFLAEHPVDERRAAAYGRLMEIEEKLYQLWEQQSTGMNWLGEELSYPIDDDTPLWIAAAGERVAALGGHLEIIAVLPDRTVTLLSEPGPESLGPESDRPRSSE